ncbi:phosphopantetheine-binding protein [Tepidamorphus sp. 3E244]|uniref:phosphopantetheine-binding protein n=1 Tax=Tepidamorphus sp. 3E244 TaxID=3385498 RepID=UPI0038FCCA1F
MREYSVGGVRADVTGMVEAILAANGNTTDVVPDATLAEIGMTSIDMVNLMMDVEARYDMMIPAEYLTPEHFRSVSTIQEMIVELLTKDGLAKVA